MSTAANGLLPINSSQVAALQWRLIICYSGNNLLFAEVILAGRGGRPRSGLVTGAGQRAGDRDRGAADRWLRRDHDAALLEYFQTRVEVSPGI